MAPAARATMLPGGPGRVLTPDAANHPPRAASCPQERRMLSLYLGSLRPAAARRKKGAVYIL